MLNNVFKQCLLFNWSGVQILHVRQAETDLFQTVTMPTFVLRGINPVSAWRNSPCLDITYIARTAQADQSCDG